MIGSAPDPLPWERIDPLYSEPQIGLERSHDKWEWIPSQEWIRSGYLPIRSQSALYSEPLIG